MQNRVRSNIEKAKASSNAHIVDISDLFLDSSDVVFGDEIHNYLESSDNFKSTYCVEIKFPQSANTQPKRLRAKALSSFKPSLS